MGREAVDMAATAGDLLVGAPVNMFAPRPVFEGALNRITEEEYKKAQAQEAAQAQVTQEMSEAQAQQELISLLLGAGALGGGDLPMATFLQDPTFSDLGNITQQAFKGSASL